MGGCVGTRKSAFFFLFLYFVCFLGEAQLISLHIALCHNWTEGTSMLTFIAKLAFAPVPYPRGCRCLWAEAGPDGKGGWTS